MLEIVTFCGFLTVFVMAVIIYVLAIFRLLDELHGYVPIRRKAGALLLFTVLTFLYFLVPGTLMYLMGAT